MQRLTNLNIAINSEFRQARGTSSMYKANVEYMLDGALINEEYIFDSTPEKLDELFKAISLKVNDLEEDRQFGRTKYL